MPRTLNRRFAQRGTRFLVYPQSKRLAGFARPELIYVNAPPGSIRPGPADDAVYVVDAADKLAYKENGGAPPYTGPRHPPAEPDPAGHFDDIEPGARTFASATVYASVKCVLEIWEAYLGYQFGWPDRRGRRLEIVPLAETDNSYAGDGYLEFGFARNVRSNPYCENFDVVAHEVGHAIGWLVIGKPARRSMAYRANDEACADLIAVVSALHFDSVVDHLLTSARGDLVSPSVLSRIGELGRTRYTRNAFTPARLATVPKLADRDLYKMALARPFTGAGFEILVGLYLEGLVERGAIPAALRQARRPPHGRAPAMRREFARRFRGRRRQFAAALFDARDYFGHLLARALERTTMATRSHATVARHLIAADHELSSGRYGALIRDCFARRGILRP